MLKRWDTRNYDIELILTVFDSIGINVAMNIPKPRRYDIRTIMKALIIKEFEKLSLRAAEVGVKQILGIRIDHSVLHFWEKKLAPYVEGICNFKRASYPLQLYNSRTPLLERAISFNQRPPHHTTILSATLPFLTAQNFRTP
jgi:hypothetical protein